MKISMYIKFQLFSKDGENLTMLTNENIKSLCIGGYYFVINGKEIPFDWDAFSGNEEEDGVFEFETGYGWMNDFELSDCYDGDYEQLGIAREDITAEMLASVEEIKEIHINFVDENDEECDFGYNENQENFRIKVLEMSFADLDSETEYTVEQSVIDKFNEGVK